MNINRALLKKAAENGVIHLEQVDSLWAFLSEHTADKPSFRFTHVLYYFGGLIAIGAMTLFMNLGWEQFGGWGLFCTAIIYAVLGIYLTNFFLYQLKLLIPAGISATFVVMLTPLAIYGLQAVFGLWADDQPYRAYYRYIDWRWILMEFATLIVGAVIFYRYRFPFLLMPIAVTLWFITMDVTPFLMGETYFDSHFERIITLWFGLVMVLFAFWIDVRTVYEKDYSFWLYLFGVISFWGGLSLIDSGSELNKFFYFMINLLMIIIGSILSRRVFVIFGALGSAGYLGHLSYAVFKDSMMFPFVLTTIGLCIVYIGILWQRHEQRLSSSLCALLPTSLQTLVDRKK